MSYPSVKLVRIVSSFDKFVVLSRHFFLKASLPALMVLPILTVGQVHARDWYIVPGVSILAGYDENPILETVGSDDVATLTTTDGVDGQSYVAIGANISLHSDSPTDSYIARLDSESRQYRRSELDTNLVNASMEYVRTLENSSYDIGISFSENSTFETGFTDTDISLTGADLKQQTFGVSTGYTRQINTRLSTELSVGYDDVGFESDSENLAEFTEYEETSLSVDLTYSVNQRLDLSSGLEFLMYRPDSTADSSDTPEQDTQAITLGLDYALRENLILQASVAPTYRDIAGGQEQESEDTTSTQYDLGLAYTGFLNTYSAGFSRSLSPSARGGLVQSDNYSFEWTRPNQYDGALSASLSFGEQVDDGGGSTDLSSFTFESVYSRSLNRYFNWILTYRYREQTTTSGSSVDSNNVSFQLQYNWGRIAIPGISG